MEHSHATAVSPDLIESKEAWHRAQAALPIREKVRILLALQRALRAWEKPWPVEPQQEGYTGPCAIVRRIRFARRRWPTRHATRTSRLSAPRHV